MKRSSAFLQRRDKSRAAVSFRGDNATIPLKFAAVAAANDNDVGGIARPHSVAASSSSPSSLSASVAAAPTKRTRKFRPSRCATRHVVALLQPSARLYAESVPRR